MQDQVFLFANVTNTCKSRIPLDHENPTVWVIGIHECEIHENQVFQKKRRVGERQMIQRDRETIIGRIFYKRRKSKTMKENANGMLFIFDCIHEFLIYDLYSRRRIGGYYLTPPCCCLAIGIAATALILLGALFAAVGIIGM